LKQQLQRKYTGKRLNASRRAVVPTLWYTSFIEVVLRTAIAMAMISHCILISYCTSFALLKF